MRTERVKVYFRSKFCCFEKVLNIFNLQNCTSLRSINLSLFPSIFQPRHLFSALSRIISISTSSILSRIVARSYIDPSHVKVVESVTKEMPLHPGKAGCKELDNFQRIPLPYGENCNIATMRKLKRSLIGAYGWIMMCCKQRHPGTTSSSHHSAV
jgi:hypothetical protein